MITVVGSVNLDIVATAKTLPAPGETVTGARLARYPGGKGANQALAAKRLGADVRLVAAVGADEMADEALSLLQEASVDLSAVTAINGETTGTALIGVSAEGENQIIVASGANDALRPDDVDALEIEHLISVLEVNPDTVLAAAKRASGLKVINLAPAISVSVALINAADVLVVNETEEAFYGEALHEEAKMVALTLGAEGAKLMRNGSVIAEAKPPRVNVVDTVGAGDTFTAALAVGLIEGMSEQAALEFAVTASALACTQRGAQPSLPLRAAVDKLI